MPVQIKELVVTTILNPEKKEESNADASQNLGQTLMELRSSIINECLLQMAEMLDRRDER